MHTSQTPSRRYGPLNDEDLRYIRASYVTLACACAGRLEVDEVRAVIRARRLPAASYVLDDGTEMVPRDYFALADEAGGVDQVRSAFYERYALAMRAAGVVVDPRVIDKEWESYLDGSYGVCLRSVTPENIFEKEALVRSGELLLARPAPDVPAWRTRLRDEVNRLDAILREFAPCDRARFGGTVSRDRVIAAAHARYPEVFEAFGNVPIP